MRTVLTGVLVGVAIGSACSPAQAEIELPPLFGEGMVIQREQPITIWGTAEAGAEVTVGLAGRLGAATADGQGGWTVSLPEMEAGGPHAVVVECEGERVVLDDVLIGDVWICSGQSNMYWPLVRTDRASEFLGSAGPEGMRLFRLDKVWSRTPKTEVVAPGWWGTTPGNKKWFSAVAFHFGRILHEETGVPIGLIETAWGGTPLEAWTPMPVFEADAAFYADRLRSLDEYDVDDETAARLVAEAQAEHAEFVQMAWREDIGPGSGWARADFDDSGWPGVEMPGYVDGALGGFNGIVWLRRRFSVADPSGEAELRLGRIDDFDIAFINGQRVGMTDVDQGDGRQIERKYTVPAGALHRGENTIAIALMDVRSSGGVNPDGKPFELRTAGGVVPLAGTWAYRVGFDDREYGGFPKPGAYAVPAGRAFRRPAALYNAMVHPLTRLGVKGAIWYQGESNAGRGDEYRVMFPDMIASWRTAWAEGRGVNEYALPFYFVQLPNYKPASAEVQESSWAELREAQRLTEKRVPGSGMAITIDLGDPGDIHPTNKLPVGERLARFALVNEYGQLGDMTGPHPVSMRIVGSRVMLRFEHADGLHAKGGSVKGLALAAEDGVFHWAEGRIDGCDVVVTSRDVPEPVRVRYGWADNPGCNLYNDSGLPATPFELPED